METYSSYPIFQTSSLAPNIMVMLDNSGSMNFAAYGTDPQSEGGLVTNDGYEGAGYTNTSGIQRSVSTSSDDAYERSGDASVSTNYSILYIGYYKSQSYGNNNYTAGIRFQNVEIPVGATITSAYITFTAYTQTSETASFTIVGEDADSPVTYSTDTNNITSRTYTAASVSWSPGSWAKNSTYNTPSLTDIVQEIVDRDGWASGNSIALKISNNSGSTGNRQAYSYDGNSSRAPILVISYTSETTGVEYQEYYGYFNPDYFYFYNTTNSLNRFEHAYKKVSYAGGVWTVIDLSDNSTTTLNTSTIVSNELWDGNWMNWLCMRRMDILKKVLIGGKASTDTDYETIVSGEIPAQTNRVYQKNFTTGAVAVCPYASNTYFGVKAGYLYLNTTYPTNKSYTFSSSPKTFKLDILKQAAYDTDEFYSGELVGVLQRIGSRARWGNMIFNTNSSYNGGKVLNRIGASMSDVVSKLSAEVGSVNTPLAETFYTGMLYFMQEDRPSGLYYESDCTLYVSSGGKKGTIYDPYYFYDDAGTTCEAAPCAKSYVLLLTDGASTADTAVPTSLQDYDNDGNDASASSGTGSDYLDDIALYAHVNDLRTDSDMDGDQNITLYAVLAFDDDEDAVALLKDAAINGGFNDLDGDGLPDVDETNVKNNPEWDEDQDGVPDNFYQASDGYKLESELLNAINDILKRAASGTAVSVLATSSEGEGNLIQAYFKPVIPSGLDEVAWGGYLQSLWVDSEGNLREDTVNDYTLNVYQDNIISYYSDEDSGDTMVKLWKVSDTEPYPDLTETQDETMDLDDVKPIWEAGKLLASRAADDRNIFTYIDRDEGEDVDGASGGRDSDPFDSTGELVSFSTSSSELIAPYLGIPDDTGDTWTWLGSDVTDRVDNLISYIRGIDNDDFRTRTISSKVWKLGDIIHSTPVSVSKPADNYHTLYGDESYGTYYKNNLNRETVVYVGANDGMLHAFTSGVYDSSAKGFFKKGADTTDTSDDTSEGLGDELWAYIPQALLPHLKWLADPDYTHVYYCDLKPKVFDAKIDSDGDGDTEWCTLLLLGLNLGGKTITATGDFDYDDGAGTADTTRTFSSSYTLIDITDPRDPTVLWERSYDDLGLTTSYPAVIRVKDKWFAVFGSGPTDYDGTATGKNGHVFVVDLETGEPYQSSETVDSTTYYYDWLFETSESNAFMNSPVSVDIGLNYNVDAIYMADSYYDSTKTVKWRGKIYKVAVPWTSSSGGYDGDSSSPDTDNYSDVPNSPDDNKAWKFVPLLASDDTYSVPAITSSIALSMDTFDNVWAYVGSGRYMSDTDKVNTDQQYMFGIKDPFYNKTLYNAGDYYHNYEDSKTLVMSDLLDSDPYLILSNGNVYLDNDGDGLLDSDEYTSANYYGNWSDLLAAARAEDGWVRSLILSGERITTKFTILGGIVFTPSFVPATDICGYGGTSYLYGQYYETGTAYYDAGLDTYELESGGEVVATQVLDKTDLGSGLASSVGVHVGSEEGAKGFIQTSSGTIDEEALETAFSVKSGLRSWRQK